MTPKQVLFCLEYLKDLNATAAYKRAGYKAQGNVAEVNASRLLRDAKVAQKIQAAMNERANEIGIDANYVLSTIKETVERCRQVAPVLDKQGKQVYVGTPEGDIVPAFGFDPKSVLRGSELLGKHLKIFTDVIEVKDHSSMSARMKEARARAKAKQ